MVLKKATVVKEPTTVASMEDPHDKLSLLLAHDLPHTYARTQYPASSIHSSAKTVAMVSVTPDGLHIGWDTCGVCCNYFTRCSCTKGLQMPKDIARACGLQPAEKPVETKPVFIPRQYTPPAASEPTVEPVPVPDMSELDALAEDHGKQLVKRLTKKLTKGQ